MSGSGEDGALVVYENLQPARNIGGVDLARFEMQFKVGAK